MVKTSGERGINIACPHRLTCLGAHPSASKNRMNHVEVLCAVQAAYCAEDYAATIAQTERDLFRIGLISPRAGLTLCDVGSGVGAFGPTCAALGMCVTVLDDFRDPNNIRLGEAAFLAHHKFGVRILRADANREFPVAGSFDVMTCFASIEHHHNSPKQMLHSMVEHLKPGGLFVLSAPNSVDLMKRFQTIVGSAQWSPIEEWYESAEFRGHVREPRLADLHYIARDLGLRDYEIVGRTFIWRKDGLLKSAMRLIARLIQPWPSLNSELFLVAYKSA